MTSIQEFKCVFCTESFDNKETLQIHFRKHGDPKFNQQKNKGRVQSAVQVSSDSSKEEAEMVGCDVCSEVFPTISKAITHKHKVHPEHDAKYFCPWCGKLFTMKHLYNKHMLANHGNLDKNEEKTFRCDCCNVDFHLPAAMLYHNKFFHRQDTDIPPFGQSKKLKMYSQEVIPIYYCSFCGEEYDNKVNLHKHAIDDHNDENQSPDVVMRCPLCDAIFYHLDAYELHLTFHTSDDLYSERSEIVDDVSEYSLESVPPIMEKVESCEPQQDAETTMKEVGIEDFLEQALEEPDGLTIKKNKKHKKHKKPKKSAITLDEFLSMNKDVFGEGLDFQGVEEVPTRVITKRLKVIKRPSNAAPEIAPELEKLRKHGIVIKKKSGHNTPSPNKGLSNKSMKLTQKIIANQVQSEPKVSTSEDTIDKLINQGNNQIKIVKKSNKDISPSIESTSPELNSFQKEIENFEANTEMECDSTKKDIEELSAKDDSPEFFSIAVEDDLTKSNVNNAALTTDHATVENIDKNQYDGIDNPISKAEPIVDVSKNVSTPLKINSNSNQIQVESTTNNIEDCTDNINNTDCKGKNLNNDIYIEKQDKIDSLSSLKHLNHLTVKPVLQTKNNPTDDTSLIKNVVPVDLQATARDNVELSTTCHVIKGNVCGTDIRNNEITNDSSLNTGKNILLKSLSSPTTSGSRNIRLQGYEETDFDKGSSIITSVQSVTSNINLVKNVKSKTSELIQAQNTYTNMAKISSDTREMYCNDIDKKDSTNLLKHLTGITAKPISLKKCPNENNTSLLTTNVNSKNVRKIIPQKEKVNDDEIETFSIDDSDDEIDQDSQKTNVDVSNTAQPIDVLKNLSKNITIKSLNHNIPEKNVKLSHKVEKEELPHDKRNVIVEDPEKGVSNDDRVTVLSDRNAVKSLSEKDKALKKALRNLSKNIIVKSRNSSPSQTVRSEQQNCENEHNEDSLKTFKITEVNDENGDCESDNYHISDNVIVESPEDSRSDKGVNDEIDMDEDFENQLKVTMLKKDNERVKSPQSDSCASGSKEICKNLPENIVEYNDSSEGNTNLDITKNLGNQISIKPVKQARKEVKHENRTNAEQMFGQTSCHSVMNQKMSMSNKVNTVNKEVMVKTFQTQTKTVIQEITTTVTKTIKTVNQTSKQEVRNVNNYSSSSMLPQKVHGMKVHQQSRNLQGIVVRHSSPPMRPNIRNTSPAKSAVGTTVRHSSQVSPVGTSVRPPNQIVPIRPRSNVVRPCNPRMPTMDKIRPSASNQCNSKVGRQLKVSSDAMILPVKRPNFEDASGPFSCFKKPKESLIPVSDVPSFKSGDPETLTEYTSLCKSNSMSTVSTLKGNSVITTTQMKSEVNSSSQQLSRLNNMSGIKVVKSSQSKQSQVQGKSEISAAQRTTLEAIQKLQKQGLLVKKPRLKRDSDGSDCSGNNSTEENDN